jgi:hypothetical protein
MVWVLECMSRGLLLSLDVPRGLWLSSLDVSRWWWEGLFQ